MHAKSQVKFGMELTERYWFGLCDFLQHAGISLILVNSYHSITICMTSSSVRWGALQQSCK